MRIVAVGDTHQFHHELVVPNGDVFIHVGDMCRGGSVDELGEAMRWIRALPHRVKIVVAGNHDVCLEDAPEVARLVVKGDRIVYLQDEPFELDGVRFWGSPWQPEYHGWAFNLPRGRALVEKWARIPDALDVLVTHGPPEGIGDGSTVGPVRAGCRDLRRRVAEVRPLVHLFGHIHEDGGAWPIDGTLFVNCTTWECERAPSVVDLDIDARTVTPIVVPPARSR
jgi:Icc-related predicted phosphoesterase